MNNRGQKPRIFRKRKNAPHLYRTFDNGFYKVFKKKLQKLFSSTAQKKKSDRNQTFFCKFTIFVGCIYYITYLKDAS